MENMNQQQDAFSLPDFLLGEIYGPQHEEGQRLRWTLADAIPSQKT